MSTRDISIWPVLGRKSVQEKSAQGFTVRFLNNRALSAPTTARYRLRSLANGEIVKDWTDIASPSSEETVTVTADLNTIRCGLRREHYELAVQSDYSDTSLRQTQRYCYTVENAAAVED